MMNFPSSPSVGQLYPVTPIAGVPTYRWDGEKWAISVTAGGAPPSASSPLMDGVVQPGGSAQWSRGDHVHPRDTSRAPIASPTFTGTLAMQALTVSGNISVGGAVSAPAKGNRFGWASGQGFASPLVQGDANILLYDLGGENWCGMGTDTGGTFWVRTGLDTRVSAAFIASASGEASFAMSPVAPTPTAGSNNTQVATTAYVVANQAVGGPYLPTTGGVLTGTLTINQGHIMTYRAGGTTGVVYLSNGDRYFYYDGTNYTFGTAPLHSAAGRLWGSGDWSRPVTNARIGPHAGDYYRDTGNGLGEPYAGATSTGSTHWFGPNGGNPYGLTQRYRYNQIYVEGAWYTAGYA